VRKTVLVVAAERDLLSLLAAILRNRGFVVWEATEGIEAIEICENAAVRPDLVLSDFQLRSMNGLGLAERIASIRPDMPIIVMSADCSRLESIEASGFASIEKPFSFDDLVERINVCLSEEFLIRQPS
jgi:DNA-binding response OmpR family regulator